MALFHRAAQFAFQCAGMASSKQLTAVKAEAMGFLLPEVGLQAMARLLQGICLGSPQALSGSAGVAQSSHWRQLLQGMTSPPPFFDNLPQQAAAPPKTSTVSPEVRRNFFPTIFLMLQMPRQSSANQASPFWDSLHRNAAVHMALHQSGQGSIRHGLI